MDPKEEPKKTRHLSWVVEPVTDEETGAFVAYAFYRPDFDTVQVWAPSPEVFAEWVTAFINATAPSGYRVSNMNVNTDLPEAPTPAAPRPMEAPLAWLGDLLERIAAEEAAPDAAAQDGNVRRFHD